MALSDLIKRSLPSTADKLGEAIARLQHERDEARARLDAASFAWGNSLADDETGDSDSTATVRLEKELNEATQAFRAKDAALTAAKARHGLAVAQASRDAQSEQWAKCIALAGARAAAAARLQRTMSDFASDYLAFVEAGALLADALPQTADMDAALLRDYQVEGMVRAELRRLGIDWAAPALVAVVDLPPFLPPFETTEGLVRSWRDSAMNKAAGRTA